MKKLTIIFITLLTLSSYLQAQNIDDALRYSKSTLSGSARYTAMGGAFGALGGDISAINTNPASAGIFKYSEIAITPTFYYSHSQTNFLNRTNYDGKGNFNLNNFGVVGIIKTNNNLLKSINYAFSYQRLDNYHHRICAEGINNQNSITDYFAEQAYGTTLSSLDDGSGGSDLVYNAYNTYLINPVTDNSDNIDYVSSYSNYGENQIHRIETLGSRRNYSFALSSNYNNKLYMGISFNFNSSTYIYQSDFQEHDTQEKIDDFKSMRYYDEYETRGSGFTFKVGFIYKVSKWLRLGSSFHTPTVYKLNDNYRHSMSSWVNVDGKTTNYTMSTSNNYYDYKIYLPLRMMGALGFIINKKAIISVEYEYLNYRLSKLRSYTKNNEFVLDNESIKNNLKSAHNIKLGAEYRWGKLSFRTGVSYFDSPYQSSQINKNAYTIYYNAGVGVNLNEFYIDFAYSRSLYNYYYIPYSLENKEVYAYNIKQNTDRYMLTMGLRF